MALLHYLSYVAALAAFVFVTLSLGLWDLPRVSYWPDPLQASGLLYISELIEEHSRPAKLFGQRGTYIIITLHVLLYVTDALPLPQTIFSVICHTVYLQNFSGRWPLISLSSPSFIASCVMAVMNHFLWFMHFSRLARDARQSYHRHRTSVSSTPGFTDIATFFGICVWLVPLFLFLSLSANDNALPTSSGIADPSSASFPSGTRRSKSSLFKSMFSLISKDRFFSDKPDGLITPSAAPAHSYPLSSPALLHSPFLSSPPRTPKSSTHQSEVDHTSFRQGRFPRRSDDGKGVVDSNMMLSSRRIPGSGRNRCVDE